MDWVHLIVEEWTATFGAKLNVRRFAAVDKVTRVFHSTRSAIIAVGVRAKMGHRRLQEALLERENRLEKLLSDSPDAMIVTDDAHRVLDANPPGLALFGVSKANIQKFTVDAFLPSNQTRFFERSGPPFIKGALRLGQCEIKRLDGKSQLVSFIFQPNFALGRHLARFQNVKFPPHGNAI